MNSYCRLLNSETLTFIYSHLNVHFKQTCSVISIFVLSSARRLTWHLLQSACLRNANMEHAHRETQTGEDNKREERLLS